MNFAFFWVSSKCWQILSVKLCIFRLHVSLVLADVLPNFPKCWQVSVPWFQFYMSYIQIRFVIFYLHVFSNSYFWNKYCSVFNVLESYVLIFSKTISNGLFHSCLMSLCGCKLRSSVSSCTCGRQPSRRCCLNCGDQCQFLGRPALLQAKWRSRRGAELPPASLLERFDIESYSDFSAKWSNFIGLVLFCVDAKFCSDVWSAKKFDEKFIKFLKYWGLSGAKSM